MVANRLVKVAPITTINTSFNNNFDDITYELGICYELGEYYEIIGLTPTTTTTTTTIIQQPQTPQIKFEPTQPKPEPVIKKEPIDTTKSHDTTSKK